MDPTITLDQLHTILVNKIPQNEMNLTLHFMLKLDDTTRSLRVHKNSDDYFTAEEGEDVLPAIGRLVHMVAEQRCRDRTFTREDQSVLWIRQIGNKHNNIYEYLIVVIR
jgi:hypothetical protein